MEARKKVLLETPTHRLSLIIFSNKNLSLVLTSKLLKQVVEIKRYDTYNKFIENQPIHQMPKHFEPLPEFVV